MGSFSDLKTPKSKDILQSVGHIITSLCYNYKVEGKNNEYNKLKEFVLQLPFNGEFKSSLINLGFRDKKGKEI